MLCWTVLGVLISDLFVCVIRAEYKKSTELLLLSLIEMLNTPAT